MPYTSIQQRRMMLDQYIQPELQRINREAPDPYWYQPGTQSYVQNQPGKLRNFMIGAGAIIGAGFIPTGKGSRVWDTYHKLLYNIEERSPRGVLKTFGGSQLLQSMGRHPVKDTIISLTAPIKAKAKIRTAMSQQAKYYSALVGRNVRDYKELVFREGQLYGRSIGPQADELLLSRASLMRKGRGTLSSSYIAQFGKTATFASQRNIIIGGRSRAQYWGRLTGGYLTDTLQKVNQLARDPFLGMLPEWDIRGIGKLNQIWDRFRLWKPLKGIGVSFRPLDFTVKAGPAHKMIGRFGTKFGSRMLLGAAIYTGASAITKSLFDETPLQLGFGAYTGFRKGRAAIGDATGVTEYVKSREEQAPGSTSMIALGSVPLSLSMTGGIAAWGRRVISKDATIATWSAATKTSVLPAFAQKFTEQYLPGSVSKYLSKGRTMASAYGLRGAMIGALLIAPFIPRAITGTLFGDKTYEELDDMYAGRSDVAIRKGRFWEFGRNPYRGDRVDYYRPHWSYLQKTQAVSKAVWGDEDLNWFQRFYRKNFTYELERQHYQDRPYPVSSPAFADFPIPFLRAPLMAIGKIIKPAVYMHTKEWASGTPGEPGTQYKNIPTSAGYEPGPGGFAPMAPQSQHDFKQIIAEERYRLTELIGLRGFMSETLQDKITGNKNLFPGPILEDAGRIGSMRRGFWDADIGGLMGTTEFIRRFLPVDRIKPWERYNPIENKMPDWLPGSEYYIDFQRGDPYAKIKLGEVRLPGRGYEILHPEVLEEGYTDFYRFKILADVAPYSVQYKEYTRRIRAQVNRGELEKTRAEEAMQIIERTQKRKARREFDEGPEEGVSFLDNYWRALSHKLTDNPIEYLTPFAPIHKFIGRQNALEQYEREVLQGGSRIALWTRPVEHFIKPASYALARNLGFDFVPKDIQHRRNIDEYFDKLEFIKYKRLEKLSREEGDFKVSKLFAKKAGETMFGLNKYTKNIGSIYRAMDARERDFYEQFVKETDEEKREKILSMVPDEVSDLYKAQWELRDAESEGRQAKFGPKEDTSKELSEFFSKFALPDREWAGWNPDLDLQDIKLKYIKYLGEDMHDYNLWESREVQLTRKPQVAIAFQEFMAQDVLSYGEVQERLKTILRGKGHLVLGSRYPDETIINDMQITFINDRTQKFDKMIQIGELDG